MAVAPEAEYDRGNRGQHGSHLAHSVVYTFDEVAMIPCRIVSTGSV